MLPSPVAIDGPGCLRTFVATFRVFLQSYDERKKLWKPRGVDAYFANYLAAWVFYDVRMHDKHHGFAAAQAWFATSRNNRGVWGGGNEGPELESTARACVALLIDPARLALEHVRTAIDYLLSEQTDEGWWPGEFLQHRSNQPYYGAMLPISFALSAALHAAAQNERLAGRIRESQAKLRRHLEHRYDRGEFAVMGALDENPVRALSWGIRMYVNSEGSRGDILQTTAEKLESAIKDEEACSKMNLQDLYNVVHSLSMLKVPICDPPMAAAFREIERRVADGVLQGSEHSFRYSGGIMLAYLHAWRAHPISECFQQFLAPLLLEATEGRTAKLRHLVREHWIALAGLIIGVVSTVATIAALWK